MARKSTAKKIKVLNNYSGEVAVFELSKKVKKGSISTSFVVVARFKPRHGKNNTTIWFSDGNGHINIIEPILETVSEDMTGALATLGYTLI